MTLVGGNNGAGVEGRIEDSKFACHLLIAAAFDVQVTDASHNVPIVDCLSSVCRGGWHVCCCLQTSSQWQTSS